MPHDSQDAPLTERDGITRGRAIPGLVGLRFNLWLCGESRGGWGDYCLGRLSYLPSLLPLSYPHRVHEAYLVI